MACWNEDVLFVHIPKTAGISVRQYMRDNSPPGEAYQLSSEDGYVDHAPLRDVEQWAGRALDSWKLIVAVIRSPYEQVLSQWWHWRDSYARGGRTEVECNAALCPDLQTWLLTPYGDYPTWYESVLLPKHRDGTPPPTDAGAIHKASAEVRQLGYYEWWLKVDGELPQNLLTVPFTDVSTRLPQALAPYMKDDAAGELPHNNRSRRREARKYHTHLSMEVCEARFAWAFEQGLVKKMGV